MRLRDLERLLQPIPPHPAPKAELEQYATPATLAAPLLLEAWTRGDLDGRRVLDLGCGTGVFALGAALLGAREAVGVDVDPAALSVATREAARLQVQTRVQWVESDVRAWTPEPFDTVLMNPPFGAQTRGADRPFLDAAFESAPVVYTIHNATTRAFVETYSQAAGYRVTDRWRLVFPLRHQYRFQEKAVQDVETVAFRLERTEGRVERD